MASQNKIEIELLGQKIVMRTSESNSELLEEILDLVRTKVKSAEKRIKTNAPNQVLLLALMEVTEEYVKAKHRTIQFKREVGEKSEHLLQMLEGDSTTSPPHSH
jgi:cell division protein ZapA (FtsZ GTPase activity inhibitor)